MSPWCSQLKNVEVWFQRASDVVRKLKTGDVDMGIVGYDMLREYGEVRACSLDLLHLDTMCSWKTAMCAIWQVHQVSTFYAKNFMTSWNEAATSYLYSLFKCMYEIIFSRWFEGLYLGSHSHLEIVFFSVSVARMTRTLSLFTTLWGSDNATLPLGCVFSSGYFVVYFQ